MPEDIVVEEEGFELREVNDPARGAVQPVVDRSAIRRAAQQVQAAAESLLRILTGGGAAPANSNYGRVEVRPPNEYESPNSAFNGTRNQYDRVRQEVYRGMPAAVVDAAGGLTSEAAARDSAIKVTGAALDALNATSMKQLKGFADTALREADNTEKFAADVAKDGDAAATARANNVATGSRSTANAVREFYEKRCVAEMTSNIFLDVQGRALVGRVVGTVAGSVVLLGGIAAWIFGFSGARKLVASFTAADISVPWTQDGVDVVARNHLSLIAAVYLVAPLTGAHVTSLTTPEGNWTVSGFIISFVRTSKATTAAADYVVQALGTPGAVTDKAEIRFGFDPDIVTPPMPGTAVDVVLPALNRMDAARFGMISPSFQFADTKPAEWTYTPATAQVVFQPASPVPATTVDASAAYKLGGNGNTAKLVVLFPANPLSAKASNRTSGVSLPTVGTPVEQLTLIVKGQNGQPDQSVTTLDATDKDASGKFVVVGQWTCSGGQIQLTNLKLLDSTMQLTVQYAIVRQGFVGDQMIPVHSVDATASVTFPAPTMAPVAAPQSKVAANRSAPVSFSIPGAQLSGTLDNTNGTWSVDSVAGTVTFKPKGTLAAGQTPVSINYTIVRGQQTSNSAPITITFLPQPGNFTLPNVDRMVNKLQPVDPTNSITVPYKVKLWNGSAPLDSLLYQESSINLATWTALDKEIGFAPLGAPIKQPFAEVSYVLQDSDGGVSVPPATLRLNFSTAPVAYKITATGTRASAPPIQILPNCVVTPSFGAAVLYPNLTALAGAIAVSVSPVGGSLTDRLTVQVSRDSTSNVPIFLLSPVVLSVGPNPVVFEFFYSVSDSSNQPSNRATVTLTLS